VKRKPSRRSLEKVTEADKTFMRLALEEARKGLGRTAPNPVVGAVLVRNGKVISRGYHKKAGTPHAEVNCLRAAKGKVKGAVMYTTLEPCDHYGRTPPCSLALLEAGVSRVVCGSSDPNPLVNGKGVARLRQAGIPVAQGVLREEADALNRPFFKFIQTRMPYVTLKAAATLDGKIATSTGDSKWVTGEAARKRVHGLRNQVDAILVGANTVRLDNPQLTSRIPKGRDPVRVVVDSKLSLSPELQLFTQKSSAKTVIATLDSAESEKAKTFARQGNEVWSLPGKNGRVDLKGLLQKLADRGCLHVLVEGGAEIFGTLLRENLADEIQLFLAPKLLGKSGLSWIGELGIGEMGKAVPLSTLDFERLGEDVLLLARFQG
jgi:diaminohydroxyphosphoribosylaminopyrimidine deaminase/5-amino-6-(5-phosphoribosylamino)uracil reductase